MRTALVNILAICSSLVTLLAGQLGVAVIEFPEEKSLTELQSAFATVNLLEMSNADRTRTANPSLKGGSVLFVQRFPASPGSSFAMTTRLKNSSAEVTGRMDHGRIALSISLMEGIQAGLRTFQKKVYAGAGPFSPGSPRILSFRQIRGRSPSVAKDQTRMQSYFLTAVVVAQYAP
jgi:hypothetical protein